MSFLNEKNDFEIKLHWNDLAYGSSFDLKPNAQM